MTYDDAIAFWYGRIDYERRQPKPGDLKLDRMRALLRLLGDPHLRLRTVHVAGTKGKGSTSAMLAAVLRAAGHRTGLFTSPHLSDISERVQVDGRPITRDEITARMAEVAKATHDMERDGDPSRYPTFFEVITALGFLHFDCRRVDLAVFEVGLGGRFDSTNVCEPVLSLITNISYDHMAILGNTLAEIAFQKAGIIKRNVPVVTTADDPEAFDVIRTVAEENDSPLSAIGRDFGAVSLPGRPFEQPMVRIATNRRDWGTLPIGLYGAHQAVNAAGVVAAVETLREIGMAIPDRAVRDGLRDVVWPARIERVGLKPLVLIDCAHNAASVAALIETMTSSFPVAGKKHLVFAASADKQIAEMLELLAAYFDEFHLTRYESNPRSADPEAMAQMLKPHSRLQVAIHADPKTAWAAAIRQAKPEDAVVVTGSVFLAGELRPVILAKS
jgi:dihydrofolate synthase / folylpolyglutamate synthase